MRKSSFLTIVSLCLSLSIGIAGTARAEEPAAAKAEEESVLTKVDAFFGATFVAPLASVLFFDLAYWDNLLPHEAMVNTKTDDGFTIRAYDDAKGFSLQKSEELKTPFGTLGRSFSPGTIIPLGPVTAKITNQTDKGFAAEIQAKTVSIAEQPTIAIKDWKGAPFSPVDANAAMPENAVVVQTIAPIALVGLMKEDATAMLEIIPTKTMVPDTLLPAPKVGEKVLFKGAPVPVLKVDKGQVSIEQNVTKWVAADTIDRANKENVSIPFIVAWLIMGALFFTFRMGFINIRAFRHAIEVTAGKYDNPNETGEVTHFQALSSALSATVGLGNIAGVAVAVSVGGPGAVFWMIVAGFLGMTSKFAECTLGQMYRVVDEKGNISGGPMRYLAAGLEELKMGPLGKILAGMFAVMCIGGSFGGGNMFQANQSAAQLGSMIPFFATDTGKFVYGTVLAILVGIVIIGGIKRIGSAAEKIVPAMCGIYVFTALFILLANASAVPAAFMTIVNEAFTPIGIAGGFVGVLIQGFRRAAFSNEAGVGSAAIAHSAATTEEPVREGIVALLEPFIDTIIVCTMTGLVIVVTGVYKGDAANGVLMTSQAFTSVIPWFDWVLCCAVILFAFSTMISWSYYGERCWTSLFGTGTSMIYRLIFLVFVVFGSVIKLGNVIDFSDLMILGMAFPNILGLFLLSGKIRASLNDYWGRYTSGEMKPVK
jgi:alanine or glycine:cation symporter, AGCS family